MHAIETARIRERAEILEGIEQHLRADDRVVAAWLWGSFGRGEADAWSDIDLWIVVRDEALEAVAAERHAWVESQGNLVLTVEAPQNGPPGGCYLMSGHDRPTGLHLIDWYWQPLSAARKPASEAILFAHEPIGDDGPASATPYFVPWHPSSEEDAANCVALAWAMIAIQAKAIVRSPDAAQQMAFHGFIESLIGNGSGTPYSAPDATGLHLLEAMANDLANRRPAYAAAHESLARYLQSVSAVAN